jgi:ABC-type sugar transport system substrate-binding protein
MSRGASLALLALLAACAPEPPVERACDAAVDNDPAVKLLIIKGVGNPYFQAMSQDELKAAKQRALLACLRNRGLAPPGGVERQKPIT